MADFNSVLRQEDGIWVYDDGTLYGTFSAVEMEDILSLEPMPDENLDKLARDIVEGRVFTSDQCSPSDLFSVFMPVALMSDKSRIALKIRGVSLLYESIDRAGPVAVNGLPTFMSFRVLCTEDHDRLRDKVKTRVKERMAEHVCEKKIAKVRPADGA